MLRTYRTVAASITWWFCNIKLFIVFINFMEIKLDCNKRANQNFKYLIRIFKFLTYHYSSWYTFAVTMQIKLLKSVCSHLHGCKKSHIFSNNKKVTKVRCQKIMRAWLLHQTDPWPLMLSGQKTKDHYSVLQVASAAKGIHTRHRKSVTPVNWLWLPDTTTYNYGQILVYDDKNEEEFSFWNM